MHIGNVASILGVVCVLLGRVITQLKWGVQRDFNFMRYGLFVVTVKNG